MKSQVEFAIQFLMHDEGIGFLGAVEWLAREAGLQ
jgi:hypothetical protein